MPTACGIETKPSFFTKETRLGLLQQCLPLAVLKPERQTHLSQNAQYVATVPTACGIETLLFFIGTITFPMLQQCLPLAVLKRIFS